MAKPAPLRRIEDLESEAERVFKLQREAPSVDERREHLRTVERVIVDDRDANAEAITRDFGHRVTGESPMLELFTCVEGIRHTPKKLPRWARPERRSVSLVFATGSNRVIPQPLLRWWR